MKTAAIQVTLIDHMGDDISVVNAARVSFEKESQWELDSKPSPEDEERGYTPYAVKLSQADTKLISYLAKHKHTSPFNHAFATFRVKAPIFVARQLVKHKFMPWNEVSRRYVDSEPEFYFPEDWRKKAENVKQGSSEETIDFPILMLDTAYTPWEASRTVAETCLDVYTNLLRVGVCAEQARMVLPQNTMTEWIWSGSLGAIADMCRLRLDPHAQKESRDVAELIAAEMSRLYPVSWEALLKNN